MPRAPGAFPIDLSGGHNEFEAVGWSNQSLSRSNAEGHAPTNLKIDQGLLQ
ncbi:hypothetical protein BLJAPNOD_04721 [Ensifer sp. M14]|nr:hypothetical protein BLJAPNOD_04721 [Ensifer sp. M14]